MIEDGAQAEWWRLKTIPRPVGNAFFYGPLSGIPILVFGSWVWPLTMGGDDYLTWAIVSTLFGVPLTYVLMVLVGIPCVLVFRRVRILALRAWVFAGATTGLLVGSVFPIPTWTEPHPTSLIWLGMGAFLGGWNAYMLWRANYFFESSAEAKGPSDRPI